MQNSEPTVQALRYQRPPFGLTAVAGSVCVLLILLLLFIMVTYGVKANSYGMIALALPVVLLCALYPIQSICGLFALLPFDFFLNPYLHIQGSLVQFLEAIVVVGVLIASAIRGRLSGRYRYGWAVVAFGLAAILSYSLSLKTHEIQVKTAETIVHCLLFFALATILRSVSDRAKFWRALRVPFAIIVAASLYQMLIWDYGFLFRLLYPESFFLDWSVPFERVTGPFEHPNTNAGFTVALFCLIGTCYAVRGGKRNMRVFWGLLALAVAVVGASGSNGAAAGLGGALVLFVWFFSKRRLRNLTWLFVAAGIAGAALWAHGGERIETSTEGRALIWGAGTQLFFASPWLGHGVGSFSEWYGDYLAAGIFSNHIAASAHSIYINTLAEMGLIGLGLLLAILYMVCRDGVVYAKAPLTEQRCISAAILCFFAYFSVHGVVDQLTFHANYSVLFWSVVAMGSACWDRVEYPRSKS